MSRNIKISKIDKTSETWLRNEFDQDAVERYKERYKSGEKEPVILQKDTNKLIDGYHRIKALKELGKKFIKAVFRDIPDSQLRQESIKANIDHGVPLSMEERNKQIFKMHKEDHLTQKEIGKLFGLTKARVNQMLSDLTTNNSDSSKDFEKAKIISHILSGNTQEETGKIYDISQPRVSQIYGEFKDKVKDLWKSGYLKEEIEEKTDVDISEDKFQEIADDEFVKFNKIIEGDCLEKLDEISDKSVGLIVTDPPYFISDEDWDMFENKDEYFEWTKEWLDKVLPKLHDEGRLFVCFSQEYMCDFKELMKEFKEKYNLVFCNLLIWNYKNNIKPNDERKFKYTYEPVFYYAKDNAKKLNMEKGKDWSKNINKNLDVITISQPQRNYNGFKEKQHPTQKPVELFKIFISLGKNKNDETPVLDPFAGSGATGIAAKQLENDFLLIEKDSDYVELIEERLKNVEI